MSLADSLGFQLEQRVNVSDLMSCEINIDNLYPVPYDPKTNRIHRVVTLKEILEKYPEIKENMFSYAIVDLKANYMIFDAMYLVNLGFTSIWFLDNSPGSTFISYDMYTKD